MDLLLESIYQQWEDGCALLDSFDEQIRSLVAKDPTDTTYRGLFPVRPEFSDKKGELAKNIRVALCQAAERRFSTCDAALSIDSDDRELREAMYDTSERYRDVLRADFHPRALWAVLEARFDGTKGVEVAYHQAAEAIVDAIYLQPTDEIRRSRSGVIIDFQIWQESFRFNKAPGNYELSNGCLQRMHQLLQGLRGFLAWAAIERGRPEHDALDAFGSFLRVQDQNGYTSRTTVGNAALSFLFFKEKAELHAPPKLADLLSEFVGQYSAKFRMEQAA